MDGEALDVALQLLCLALGSGMMVFSLELRTYQKLQNPKKRGTRYLSNKLTNANHRPSAFEASTFDF